MMHGQKNIKTYVCVNTARELQIFFQYTPFANTVFWRGMNFV
jgi:hypothetical protein